MDTDTIIGAYAEGSNHIASFVEGGAVAVTPEAEKAVIAKGRDGARPFMIRAADEGGHRSSANILIERRYGWRGYHNATLPAVQTSNRMTFSAVEGEATIGTITIAMDDGQEAVVAEEFYPDEVRALRDAGKRICEFTKLAMDPVTGSRRVLASLFHVAYIVAHRLRKFDMLLLEVAPRHVAYYRRMLGCRVIGSERLNTRVNSPCVLLGLEFTYIRQQIAIFGSHPEMATMERSLYPYAFAPGEEAGIIARMNESLSSFVQTMH